MSSMVSGYTHKVKIFCHDGERVLYSVCVCSLALTNSSTQKGSDFPPRSAAARPVARYTFTVKCPTSRRLCKVFFRACKAGHPINRSAFSPRIFLRVALHNGFRCLCALSGSPRKSSDPISSPKPSFRWWSAVSGRIPSPPPRPAISCASSPAPAETDRCSTWTTGH